MAWLSNVLQLLQVIAALGVVILVLLQHGKGADLGAAFGSGSSGSLFGASGSANFLSRATAGCAVVFFVTTLGLAFMANQRPGGPASVMEGMQTPAGQGTRSDVPESGTGGARSGVPATDANSQIPSTQAPQTEKKSDIPQ